MRPDLFEYRIVELKPGFTRNFGGFMPQRGVSGHLDGISSKIYWCDALPMAAPNRAMADAYVVSLKRIDSTDTEGTVVWITL